jgi:cytochrome c oxidase subunit 2
MVLPGYEYVATITPTESGEFSVVCNEFCAIGHHLMLGKIIVE